MSNTDLKNITRVDDDDHQLHGYLVRVQWRGEQLQAWIPDERYQDPLNQAIRARNRFERGLHKPRTEKHIRSSGRVPWLKRKWRRPKGSAA